jgi:hypothetical protein
MSAAGLMLHLHQTFRMVLILNLICFKDDYCFRITTSCSTILMHPKIYQAHSCKIYTVKTNRFLLMKQGLIYHCKVQVIKGFKKMQEFLFKN